MIRRTLTAMFLTLVVGGAVAACNSTPAATSTPAPVVPTTAPSEAPSDAAPSVEASPAASPSP